MPQASRTKIIYIIAGEASGDAIGAKLIKSFKQRYGSKPNIEFHGIGGTRMEAEGLKSLFPMSELSLMGFLEIVPHIPKLLKRIKQTCAHIDELSADMVVTIDSPGFTFRIAKQLKAMNHPAMRVHYVAPTVWAYKPERAKTVADLFDHLLVLFPFEVPFFTAENIATTCVGHPITEEHFDKGNADHFRSKHHIDKDTNIISILCGSRKGEIKRLFPIIKDAIDRYSVTHKNIALVFPTTSIMAPYVKELCQQLNYPYYIITDASEKRDAYAASIGAICKSGTVALELALAKLPHLVIYKVNTVTYWYVKRLINVEFANLINLLLGHEVIEEYIQLSCTPEDIESGLQKIIINNTFRNQQLESFEKAASLLNPDPEQTPSEKAASCLIDLMKQTQPE